MVLSLLMGVAALQRDIRGTVVAIDAADYEAVRQRILWNQLCPDRRPNVIVQAAGEADVIAAVAWASERGMKIAIRSGGHSWCGTPLRDGGLLLDLGRLTEVSLEPAARTAAVQPAVTGRELSRHLHAHGLAFPFGHCSTVGLGGYLLSGGFGWNSNVWGPACFNLRAIDVVTADGSLLRASDTEHADLFWAARGAGPGFFGVVTRFHLALHALPQAMTTSTQVYPLARLPELARWLPELAHQLPKEVELTVLLAASPPGGTSRISGSCIVLTATAFVDDQMEATTALEVLEESPLLHDTLMVERPVPTPFETLFDMLDAHFPTQHRCIADTVWSNDSPERVLASVQALLARPPSPHACLLCVMPPPPPPDVSQSDMAFSMRAQLFVACYAVWQNPADDARNRSWHHDVMAALEPFAIGHYVGESDIVTTPARAPRAFAPPNWQRLQAVRQRYDPHGIFHGFVDESLPSA